MSTHRFRRRIDRRPAEQLLDGAPTSRRLDTPDALDELLRAAAGPARAGELAGEQAAVAAFGAARLAPVPRHRRLSMIKTTLASLLTAKILVPTAAAATVGGLTLAGVTGALPLPGEAPSAPPAEVTTGPRTPASTPAGEVPAQGLVGLCQAYAAGSADERGRALDSPAFQVLITEAGGPDNVAEYCADLPDARPGKPAGRPSGAPTTPAHPTGKPAERPGAPEDVPSQTQPAQPTSAPAHPTGEPTAKPTSAHPTGAPEAVPAP